MKIARGAMLAPVLMVAALVAGCGSSSSSSSSSSTAAAASPTTTQSASSSSAASASASGGTTVLVGTKPAKKLGKILDAGPKHKTVYLFEADKGGKSACSGACAGAWPPVTGSAKAVAGAEASHLGTITRSDGTKQVTYGGHPLYYFIKDKDAGDAYGAGSKAFGAKWYALKPNGSKLDNT
jgi:predicted lipoprotein with Yx(FWY)xxD motif